MDGIESYGRRAAFAFARPQTDVPHHNVPQSGGAPVQHAPPQSASHRQTPERWRSDPAAQVLQLVQTEVIPRLLLSRRGAEGARTPTAAHVDTLARLALARDGSGVWAQVSALRDAGAPVSGLFGGLIGPAARRLGDMWCNDSADFVEVALGCGRLAVAARRLGAEAEAAPAAGAPRLLVATLETERHTLGAAMLAESMRCSGWSVSEAPAARPEALGAMVGEVATDVVGLSVGGEAGLDAARAAISALRAASPAGGAAPKIAVGGPALASNPGLVAALGADFSAADGASMLLAVRAHLPKRA